MKKWRPREDITSPECSSTLLKQIAFRLPAFQMVNEKMSLPKRFSEEAKTIKDMNDMHSRSKKKWSVNAWHKLTLQLLAAQR